MGGLAQEIKPHIRRGSHDLFSAKLERSGLELT